MTQGEMRNLWNLLGQTWGSRFLEQYGTEPNDAWTAFLAAIEPEAARYALRALVLEGSPFPPTLPEFVALCRKQRRDQAIAERNAAVLERLPPSASDPEIAARNLRELREILKA